LKKFQGKLNGSLEVKGGRNHPQKTAVKGRPIEAEKALLNLLTYEASKFAYLKIHTFWLPGPQIKRAAATSYLLP